MPLELKELVGGRDPQGSRGLDLGPDPYAQTQDYMELVREIVPAVVVAEAVGREVVTRRVFAPGTVR